MPTAGRRRGATRRRRPPRRSLGRRSSASPANDTGSTRCAALDPRRRILGGRADDEHADRGGHRRLTAAGGRRTRSRGGCQCPTASSSARQHRNASRPSISAGKSTTPFSASRSRMPSSAKCSTSPAQRPDAPRSTRSPRSRRRRRRRPRARARPPRDHDLARLADPLEPCAQLREQPVRLLDRERALLGSRSCGEPQQPRELRHRGDARRVEIGMAAAAIDQHGEHAERPRGLDVEHRVVARRRRSRRPTPRRVRARAGTAAGRASRAPRCRR